MSGVAGPRRRQRRHQDLAFDFGDHQPVSGWPGGVEEWIVSPYVHQIVGAQIGMLEQVGGLVVDLEGCFIIQELDVEALRDH